MIIIINNKAYTPYAIKIENKTILKGISKNGETIILNNIMEVKNNGL